MAINNSNFFLYLINMRFVFVLNGIILLSEDSTKIISFFAVIVLF